jgi:uncharacterized membrane protein
MKQSRLDNFSDSIFAIILTLLAFELHIPELIGTATEGQILDAVVSLGPTFISFILSFALIFTYWRAHHFIVSIYAKSVDKRLSSINAIFFFFICTLPFSSSLLGGYSYSKTAVFIYGLNIILISLSLIWMRSYVLSSGNIDHARVGASERRRGAIRLVLPLLCAVAAILISFVNTEYSFILFAIAIAFNILPGSTHVAEQVIETVHDQVSSMAK